jgi:hypothetical protein
MVHNRDVILGRGKFLKDSKLVFAVNDGEHVLHQVAVSEDGHIHDIIHGKDVIELVSTR